MRNWKIVKWDARPKHTTTTEFRCSDCGKDAKLAVSGMAIAQVGDGLVFDSSRYSMAEIIQCPHCRRRKGLS